MVEHITGPAPPSVDFGVARQVSMGAIRLCSLQVQPTSVSWKEPFRLVAGGLRQALDLHPTLPPMLCSELLPHPEVLARRDLGNIHISPVEILLPPVQAEIVAGARP